MAAVSQAELHGCHRSVFEGCQYIKFCCPACNSAGTQTQKARPEELQRHMRAVHSNSPFMVNNKFDYRTATVQILSPATGAVTQTLTARQYADLINGPGGFAFLTNLNAPTAQHVRSAPGTVGASAPLPPAAATAIAPPLPPPPPPPAAAAPAAVLVPAAPPFALGTEEDMEDDDEILRWVSAIENLRQATVSQQMASNANGLVAANHRDRLLALDLSIDPILQLPPGQVPHPFQQRCWNGQHQLIAAYTRYFIGQEGLAVNTANRILSSVGMQASILSGVVFVGCLC